ncbi:MAG: hypothetical protein GY852_03750, partial [bacterium]|nr:hypothetical protein [bacterium]
IPDEPLSIAVHNRFDHTNFNELDIKWSYGDQSGKLENADLKPHQKGTISIPAHTWNAGEELHIEFYQNDTMLVDRYNLVLGREKLTLPVCQPGNLELKEENNRLTLTGKEFRLHVNTNTGLMEDVIMEKDTLIKSGPYLNLRVPGSAIQYSTIEMDDLAQDWKCTKFSYYEDQGMVVLETEGHYGKLHAYFSIKIDEQGIMEISYGARVNEKNKTIQEAGIKFLTGSSLEKISWKRNPYFTAYPESHPGRAVGEAMLSYKPESYYRTEPGHGWEHDSRSFYYFGLEEKLSFSNE